MATNKQISLFDTGIKSRQKHETENPSTDHNRLFYDHPNVHLKLDQIHDTLHEPYPLKHVTVEV